MASKAWLFLIVGLGLYAEPCAARSRVAYNLEPASTICAAILGRPGRMVTVEADFISDRLENSLLHDAACPEVAVRPYEVRRTVKDQNFKEFKKHLYADILTPHVVSIHVVLRGVLRREGRQYRLDVYRYLQVGR